MLPINKFYEVTRSVVARIKNNLESTNIKIDWINVLQAVAIHIQAAPVMSGKQSFPLKSIAPLRIARNSKSQYHRPLGHNGANNEMTKHFPGCLN